jgi:hypothetical protein
MSFNEWGLGAFLTTLEKYFLNYNLGHDWRKNILLK